MGEDMTFLPRSEVMTLEECLRTATAFVGLGASKIRITGGEPLVRRGVDWLIGRIAEMPGVREVVLTTNGTQLPRLAGALRAAGLRRINISLDTLDPERFRQITRIGELDRVLRGIDAALEAGFTGVKLNCVLMSGFNDQELPALVQFAVDRGINIAFIEEMPLGVMDRDRENAFLSAERAREIISRDLSLTPSDHDTGGPARYWQVDGTRTQIGFITPHSHNFCEDCNRVRVSARGELFPCLGHNDMVNLLPVMREHLAGEGDAIDPLRAAIINAMGIKPRAHDFTAQMASPQVVRFMSMTGG